MSTLGFHGRVGVVIVLEAGSGLRIQNMVSTFQNPAIDPYAILTPLYDARSDVASKAALCELIARQTRSKTVLDLCCGTGNSMVGHLAAGRDVTGVDSSRAMLEIAQQKLERFGAGWHLVLSDIRSASFPAESFSIIQSLSFSLNYLPLADIGAILERLSPSLEDGGIFAADFLYPASFREHFESLRWETSDYDVCASVAEESINMMSIRYEVVRKSDCRKNTSLHRLHKIAPDDIKSAAVVAGLTVLDVPQSIFEATPPDRFFLLSRRR